jgi:hypothetical protein
LRDGIDDARLDEIYAGVRARRRSRRWRQRVLVPALALTCAAAAVVAVRREAPAAEVVAPRDALRFADGGALVPAAVLEVAELAPPRVIALSDGTRITLGAGSRRARRPPIGSSSRSSAAARASRCSRSAGGASWSAPAR